MKFQKTNRDKHSIERNGKIIISKFQKYLLPCALTNVALSLNEFFDSLLVAQLLSSQAMAIVNIATPLMFIACAIYYLMGDGGAILYSQLVGERKRNEANSVLTASIFLSLVFGVVVAIGGLIFINPLSVYFSAGNEEIFADIQKYLVPTLISIPVITTTLTIQAFFPASGSPSITTKTAIITNVLNILLDVMYIKLFHFGVEGAALATLTSYIFGILYFVYLFKTKKVHLDFGKLSFKHTLTTIKKGLPDSFGQIGLTFKVSVSNSLALMFGGTMGIEILSVCFQANSAYCILIASIYDSTGPIISTLHGQRDHEGNKIIIYAMFKSLLLIGVFSFVAFAIFPVPFLKIHGISPDLYSVGTFALIIYSIHFIIRGAYLGYRQVLTSIGLETYATFLSMFDGIFSIIGLSYLFTYLYGLDGLWYAVPAAAFLTFVVIVVINIVLLKKDDKYNNIFLLPEAESNSIIFNASLEASNKSISNLSESIINFSKDNNLENELAYKLGLLAEEMVVYTRNHHQGHFDIDVIVNITDQNIYIDFRSDTTPFNPLVKDEKDNDENYSFLSKIASSIEYDYILGMNSTRIIINRIS